jgi:hypothetical protein
VFLACGSKVLLYSPFLVFALCERKNQKRQEDKVPLRAIPMIRAAG